MKKRQGEVLPGDTRDLGSRIEGSNPSALTKKRRGYTPSIETRQKVSNTISRLYEEKRKLIPYELLTLSRRKAILLEECGHRCTECNQGEVWNGKRLVLQLEHRDGDPTNTSKDNETMLCPNCHTQTPTYCQMNPEEKEKHQQAVLKAMRSYGTERRRQAQETSPWKGSIK